MLLSIGAKMEISNQTNFTITGQVIEGEKVGRTINFPTANLNKIPQETELKPGVYMALTQLKGQTYPSLAYFGPRLVLGQTKNVFEVFLLNFDQNIYTETLTVQLFNFIRPPLKLNSLEKLKQQIQADLNQAQLLIEENNYSG